VFRIPRDCQHGRTVCIPFRVSARLVCLHFVSTTTWQADDEAETQNIALRDCAERTYCGHTTQWQGSTISWRAAAQKSMPFLSSCVSFFVSSTFSFTIRALCGPRCTMAFIFGLITLSCVAYVSTNSDQLVTSRADTLPVALRRDTSTVLPSTLKVPGTDTRRPHGLV
jgi:hypothetical protein